MKRNPRELSGRQRRHLRGLAHPLQPVVRVGKEGVTDGVVAAVEAALHDHELIKVRVLEGCALDRGEVGARLEETNAAHLVGQVGRVVILYRRHPEAPTIRLPADRA